MGLQHFGDLLYGFTRKWHGLNAHIRANKQHENRLHERRLEKLLVNSK
jgi:hypothetical protein